MKHYGDITKLSGYDLPIVDVITGGSPCQDLSVAGKRAGLAGERSGLFMEQIRLVKEMRTRDERDNGRSGFLVRPRYMVWENVAGAFSSNNGNDFKAVLEKIVGIVEADVPDLHTAVRGGWTKSGCLYSQMGRWSIAWAVHNAAEWGVPQRRVRISLVADFGGMSAPEILFERKGMSRDPEPCGETGKDTSGTVRDGTTSTSGAITIDPRQISLFTQEEIAATLGANSYKEPQAVTQPILLESNQNHATVQTDGISTSLPASMGMGGGYVPMVTDSVQRPCISIGNGQAENASHPMEELSNTLSCMHDQNAVVVYENHSQDSRYKPLGDTSETVSAKYGTGGNKQPLVNEINSVVRRLTPKECERLQGYPDDWTNIGDWVDSKGKKHKGDADSPRYKALGNSIALPFWQYLARRICAQYERPVTLGSLFDGIGGFPLVFSRCGAIPTWASEIEEFCIAVTKYHFPEKE